MTQPGMPQPGMPQPGMSGAPQVAPVVGIDPNRPGVPLLRSARTEFRKIYDTRAPRWLLGVLGLAWVIVLLFALTTRDPSFAGPADAMSTMARIVVAVLTILLVTGEWGQRSIVTTFTLEPRRERVVAAKLAAALVFAVIVTLAGLVLVSVATLARGTSFEDAGSVFQYLVVAGLFDLLRAFAFALLFLNTAGAVACYFALPEIMLPILLLVAQDDYEKVGAWIYPRMVLNEFISSDSGVERWSHLLVCSVVWIGIPLMGGLYRVMTREVK